MSLLDMAVTEAVMPKYDSVLEKHFWVLQILFDRGHEHCYDIFIATGREDADAEWDRIGMPAITRAFNVAQHYMEVSEDG